MGNSLRCCLACMLPCGALDLIRIVHLNGNVEELTGRVTAGEVLSNNPNHVLTKPTSQGVTRRILILSPESELKRGSIYFLIPSSSLPGNKDQSSTKKSSRKYNPEKQKQQTVKKSAPSSGKCSSATRRRKSSGGDQWKPYLESICEDLD